MRKFALICLLFSLLNIQAQEKPDSLWNVFAQTLNETMLRQNPTIRHWSDGTSRNRLVQIILNSPIEERALEYLRQNLCRHPLPNVRDLAGGVFRQIVWYSNSQSARKKAIGYLFHCYIEPERLNNFWLDDFDDKLKQKIIMQYTRQFAEEDVTFFAESNANFRMANMSDYRITNTIRNHQDTISHKEARQIVFDSIVEEERQRILTGTPSGRIMMISAQLNMKEVIPYLKEFADMGRRYAVYALALMRVEDFEYRAAADFAIDTYRNDTRIASFINSQKVWYAYIHRLKSKNYLGFCPVAYRTMNDLAFRLRGFPRNIYEDDDTEIRLELDDGDVKIIPRIRKIIEPLVPEDCNCSSRSERAPINSEHIRIVVDWMRANKGNFQPQLDINRTY